MVFLLQILPDFSGVQSEFDRDLIKMRSIFRIPFSYEKNGKMGKTRAFSEKMTIFKNIERNLCIMTCFYKKLILTSQLK